MAKQTSLNIDVTINADGFSIAGGTTPRKITTSGADVAIVGAGASVYTFPVSTSTLASLALTENLTNKTLDNTNTITLKDSLFTLQDDGDVTKQAKFQLSGISAGNTRTITIPNTSDTMAVLGLAQTFSADQTFTSDIIIGTAGKGVKIKEGTNATMGVATLVGGTVTVNTTSVLTASRIFLTTNGGTLTNVGSVYISARTNATSFTISSINVLDTSDVAWVIFNPAP